MWNGSRENATLTVVGRNTLPAKIGNIWKPRWKHSYSIFWFAGNGLPPTKTSIVTLMSQITGVSIVCSTVCSDVDQRKHQSSASLAWPVIKRNADFFFFSFDDVIMQTPFSLPLIMSIPGVSSSATASPRATPLTVNRQNDLQRTHSRKAVACRPFSSASWPGIILLWTKWAHFSVISLTFAS